MRAETVLVDLTVDPARPGRNDIHLYVLRPDGLPQKVVGITATGSLPAKGVEGLPLTMLRAGSNHFQGLGANLPLTGTWRIDAQVRVDEFTDEAASTSIVTR
jgi:copper transport protein